MPRRRAALARAKRVEALTSHAVACLAVGAVFRVLMWLLLMLEGEFHMLLAPRCPTLSDCHLRGAHSTRLAGSPLPLAAFSRGAPGTLRPVRARAPIWCVPWRRLLMLGDFVLVALLADFLSLYAEAVKEGGLEANVSLNGAEMA